MSRGLFTRRRAVLAALAALIAASPLAAAAACIPARQVLDAGEAERVAFRQPSDIALAGDRILVLDDLNGRVAILDANGRSAGAVPLPGGSGVSRLGLGFGGADQLFVSSPAEGIVEVVDLAGKRVHDFVVGEVGVSRPTGVYVSRTSVFVADGGVHRVGAFTLEGRELSSWGGLGEGPQQFRSPWRIAQDSLERILVTDALNSRVLVFTPRGEPLLAFGDFGVTEGTLFRPTGIAVMEGDRVVVADGYFGSLQVFDPQGGYVGVLCDDAGKPLALESPSGLAARGRTVYAVETGGDRVRAFEIGRR